MVLYYSAWKQEHVSLIYGLHVPDLDQYDKFLEYYMKARKQVTLLLEYLFGKWLLLKLPRNGVLFTLRLHETVKSVFLSFLSLFDPTK